MTIPDDNGWIGGLTYLGVDGWTRTEYGTLIPPNGWSFTGQGFVSVVADENDALQFGVAAGALPNKSKCSYCGQYGEHRSACQYCGAPIDPKE